ncbi:lipoprotein [Psychrobacter sp.]|uniref:LPS translocon maturation chaperone LptM n=1 Tax=Psychrobacter sp. TaxID=56811 RepID=UPI0025D78D10|nr:lipoprotein [Psychrobacter sp.]
MLNSYSHCPKSTKVATQMGLNGPKDTGSKIFAISHSILLMTVSLTLLIVVSTLLTGCGQKGDLYLTKDAPNNTDFILYKANKPQIDNSSEAKTQQAIEQQKVEEASIQDPENY